MMCNRSHPILDRHQILDAVIGQISVQKEAKVLVISENKRNLANPGDLAWKGLEALGELTVYDRTKADETVARAADAEVVLTNKVIISRVLTKCQTLCEKGQRKDMNETR